MYRPIIAEVFDVPNQREANSRVPWVSMLTIAAIVIGATLALVVVNETATSPDTPPRGWALRHSQ